MIQVFIMYEWVEVTYIRDNMVTIIDDMGFPNLYDLETTPIRIVGKHKLHIRGEEYDYHEI